LGETRTSLPAIPAAEARMMGSTERVDRFGGRWFVEVSAPAYSPDRRAALVYIQAAAAVDGFWASIRVFERRDDLWQPTRCGLNLSR
jgi:hypothetical protein